MSIFGNIMKKIFHRDTENPVPQPSPSASPTPSAPASSHHAPEPLQPTAASAAPPSSTSVDVGEVLETMAAMKDDRGGNYKSSIVDLLKLLDLDSSLSARKELAQELGVHAGADGSAEQNVALHRAVMEKLAANGGVVPDDLRH